MNKLKKTILSNKLLLSCLSFIYSFGSILLISGKSQNVIKYKQTFLRKTRILARKQHNSVYIMPGSHLVNCTIAVYGEYNKLIIEEGCSLRDVEIHIEDNNNEVTIGRKTTIAGFTHLSCIEGTNIKIGEDCMFSKDITFRTGDSHSILDLNGQRINHSKDIVIGNHVWVGNRVIVTKGSSVNDNSIIGTGSIVTKVFDEPNIIITGVPAKKVKEDINWLRERI